MIAMVSILYCISRVKREELVLLTKAELKKATILPNRYEEKLNSLATPI
jgi:hypothetical protein